MTKIKICGLTREEDIAAVNEAKPDYIGFVFAPGRKRTVSALHAARLKSMLSPEIKAVGVFYHNTADAVIAAAELGAIDIIQLHGDEDEAFIEYVTVSLKEPLPVIKAVSTKNRELLQRMEDNPYVDYLLFDTFEGGAVGGTGKTFDWSTLPECSKPFFLAGGLNLSNVRQALSCGAYALDISSGAEINGVKDRELIRSLVSVVKNQDK